LPGPLVRQQGGHRPQRRAERPAQEGPGRRRGPAALHPRRRPAGGGGRAVAGRRRLLLRVLPHGRAGAVAGAAGPGPGPRRRRHSPEEAAAALDVLEQQIESFQKLVLDLLEISRLESGTARLEREPVEPDRFARSVLTATDRAAVPLGVEPGAPQQAMVDPRRLSQMLVNLLDNADR